MLRKTVRRPIAALIALIAALASPTLVLAMTAEQYFDDGNRLYRDDLYWAALLRYRQAEEAGLDTPLLHYNTGVAHYRAGQHIRARESLLKALDSPRLRVATQYNLGLNAYAAGDEEEALRWFRMVRDQQQNEKLRDYARVAIVRIRAQRDAEDPIIVEEERRRRETRFTDLDLHAQVSFGSDSNVFRTPSQPYIDFSDAAQPLVTPEVRSGAYMPVRLGAKYKVNAFKFEGFFGEYRLQGRYYQDKELDNANEYIHELGFGNEYRRRDEETGRERRIFSAFRIAQHDEVYFDPDDGQARSVNNVALDDRFDYLRYGPELYLRQSWERLRLGLRIKGQLWDYETVEAVPEWDHEYFLFGGFAQYRFTPTSLLRLTVDKSSRRFGDRRARDADGSLDINNALLRYDYLNVSLMARQRITDSLWFGVEYERSDRQDRYVGYYDYTRDSYGGEIRWQLGSRFELAFDGYYRLYNYPNAFAFNNPALPRKTLEVADATLTAEYRITRNLSIVLEADYRERASNDARIQYDRNEYVLGVRWEQ